MKKIDKLESRYFDGLTTDSEELWMKRWLMQHPDGHDELRAVMSLLVEGRRNNHIVEARDRAETHHRIKTQHNVFGRRLWRIAAAVAVVVVMVIGVYSMLPHLDCIAWVNGKTVTDERVVMDQLNLAIGKATPEMQSDEAVKVQMNDVMNTINGEE